MGMIRIEVGGSFEHDEKTFSARYGGHAQAVAEAIEWLSSSILPAAIKNDHKCQADREYPENNFGLSVG
jgi:hypothetical protein